jgi:hypothetical protein
MLNLYFVGSLVVCVVVCVFVCGMENGMFSKVWSGAAPRNRRAIARWQ